MGIGRHLDTRSHHCGQQYFKVQFRQRTQMLLLKLRFSRVV
jgi:hypothetical protein